MPAGSRDHRHSRHLRVHQGVEGRLYRRGLPWPYPARPPAHGCPQHDPARRTGTRRDAARRPQDALGVRSLQHRLRWRPANRRAQLSRPRQGQFRDSWGQSRSIAESETLKIASEFWRRRPDLNRGWRFCRPLPYHLATAPVGRGVAPEVKLRAYVPSASTPAVRRAIGRATALRSAWATVAACRSEGWSGKRDSNPRLRPWQGRTLPLSYSRPRRDPRPRNVPYGRPDRQGSTARRQARATVQASAGLKPCPTGLVADAIRA